MTGFGSASLENEKLSVSVEVKTLNSKFLDAIVRLPKAFSDKEIELRNSLTERLERGKVVTSIDYQELGTSEPKVRINKDLVKKYYQDLKALNDELGAGSEDLFRMATQMPQAIEHITDNDSKEDEWKMILKAVDEAVAKCQKFREEEGATLEGKIRENIAKIAELLEEVKKYDPERIKNIKERIRNNIEEFMLAEKIDENRYEQELIYYIEKLDINEEKVRLGTHLDYFIETIKHPKANGKKLSFISQEIGREINTIGSKANDATVQKLVVQMKDELEQIKEQILNIL